MARRCANSPSLTSPEEADMAKHSSFDVEEVRRLYIDEVMSQEEIAVIIGCSQAHVSRILRRNDIPRRPAIKRDQRGERNTSWRGGRRVHQGYVYLCLPDHPLADIHGTVPEHIAVAYEKYGHAAPTGQVVHHINMISTDNWPENLVYVPKRLHHLLHRQFEQVVPLLLKRGILSFDVTHGYYVTGTTPSVLKWDEQRSCEQCGESFLVQTKRPTQRYCGLPCAHIGRRGTKYQKKTTLVR